MCYAIFNSRQCHDGHRNQSYIYTPEEYFWISNLVEKIEKGSFFLIKNFSLVWLIYYNDFNFVIINE